MSQDIDNLIENLQLLICDEDKMREQRSAAEKAMNEAKVGWMDKYYSSSVSGSVIRSYESSEVTDVCV